MKINQSIIERRAERLTDESQTAVPKALPVETIEGNGNNSGNFTASENSAEFSLVGINKNN